MLLHPLIVPKCPFVDLPTSRHESSQWGGGVSSADKRIRGTCSCRADRLKSFCRFASGCVAAPELNDEQIDAIVAFDGVPFSRSVKGTAICAR